MILAQHGVSWVTSRWVIVHLILIHLVDNRRRGCSKLFRSSLHQRLEVWLEHLEDENGEIVYDCVDQRSQTRNLFNAIRNFLHN